MAVFFFLIGLELKREVLEGELSDRRKVMLPLGGAVGGMALPALIYIYINRHHPSDANGWAIPAATDIAFALGILALLGSRVPPALKIFLASLAPAPSWRARCAWPRLIAHPARPSLPAPGNRKASPATRTGEAVGSSGYPRCRGPGAAN